MNESFEPIDGARVRIKVEVDDRLIIDADLTTIYLRTKYGADDTLMPFHFVPFAPPDDDDEDQTPAAALRGRLRFTIDDNDCTMCQNGTHPTLLQLGRCPNCGRFPATEPNGPAEPASVSESEKVGRRVKTLEGEHGTIVDVFGKVWQTFRVRLDSGEEMTLLPGHVKEIPSE